MLIKTLKPKWPITVGAMLVAAMLAAVSQVHAGPDPQSPSPLWQKAAHYMARNHWIPGKLVEHERTFNLKGKLEEETHVRLRLSQKKNGEIRLKTIWVKQNGKDVTRYARSSIDCSLPLDDFIGDSPFTPNKKRPLKTWKNGQEKRVGDRLCTGFEFVMGTKQGMVEGTMWLDQSTGLPVVIHTTITSVPFEEEEVTITAYQSSDHFTITSQGDCLLIRTMEKMDVEIPKIGFKGKIITETVGEDHWKYTP